MGEVKSMFVKSGKEPVLFPIGICTIPGSWAEGYMLKVKVVILAKWQRGVRTVFQVLGGYRNWTWVVRLDFCLDRSWWVTYPKIPSDLGQFFPYSYPKIVTINYAVLLLSWVYTAHNA